MKTSANQKFTISIQAAGKNISVTVQQDETTDGQPYYSCSIDGKEIQLRNEGKWEQMWGDLNPDQVDEIGRGISQHLQRQDEE